MTTAAMYLEHFHLDAEPFSLTPDPAFLFKSEVHAEALAALKLGLIERRGLIAMIGEVGTGKTTLLYALLSSLGPRIRTAYVSNSKLSFDGMLRSALKDFGSPADGATRLDLLETLNEFLLECDRQGHTAALIVDEAQNLSDDAFEELRLLSNYETYKRKLLQIVLVGQPELGAKLRQPNLRQVAERVAVRAHVNPLSREDCLGYIEHRLAAVGGSSDIFTKNALSFIARHSEGIPRRINVLCHNAMLFAYGRNTRTIDKSLVQAASRERDGRGLVVLDGRSRAAARPTWATSGAASRAFASIGTSGLAWGLTGLVMGIFGAFVSMSFLQQPRHAPVRVSAGETTQGEAPAGFEVGQAPPPAVPVANQDHTAPASAETLTVHASEAEREAGAATAEPAAGAATAEPATAEPAAGAATAEPAAVAAVQPQAAQDKPVVPAAEPTASAPVAAVSEAEPTVAAPAPAVSETVAPAAHAHAAVPARATAEDSAGNEETSATPAARQAAGIVRPPAGAVTASAAVSENTAATAETGEQRLASLDSHRLAPAPPPAATTDKPRAAAPAVEVLTATRGTTLTQMVRSVYGDYSTALLDAVREANPQIEDPDFILAGDRFRFPSPKTPPTSRRQTP